MSDEPHSPSFPEDSDPVAALGAEAAARYLNLPRTGLQNESLAWIQENPTLSVGLALVVGIALGRLAVH